MSSVYSPDQIHAAPLVKTLPVSDERAIQLKRQEAQQRQAAQRLQAQQQQQSSKNSSVPVPIRANTVHTSKGGYGGGGGATMTAAQMLATSKGAPAAAVRIRISSISYAHMLIFPMYIGYDHAQRRSSTCPGATFSSSIASQSSS